MLAQLRLEIRLGHGAGAEGDVRHHRLAGQFVGGGDDRGLRDRGVRDQSRFDLGGRQPVTGDIDDVVDASGDPEVAVLVAPGPVPSEVRAGPNPPK